jgi:capsule polysaccharide export protein KpsE/RkpR
VTSALDLSFLRARSAVRRVAYVALGCAVAGGLYGLLAPRWYRAVLTVVPAKPPRFNVSSMLGPELGAIAAGFDAPGGSADAARIAAVLQSVAVSDATIAKFDLRARYGEKYLEGARDALWRHCEVNTLVKPNLVQLSCEDKDPRFVQEMLGYMGDIGNQVFRRVGVSSATEEVRFVERRVAELRAQSDEAAARMRDFQEKHHIVDLETQAKAVVSSLATLNTQSIRKQLEVDYARRFSSSDEATVRELEAQLSVVDEKLRDLQEPRATPSEQAEKPRRRGKDASGGMFPAALDVPRLRAEFETLVRDRKVAELSLVFALERLEAARANEARDVSTFQVLDPPPLPTRPIRPRPLQTALLAAVAGLVAAAVIERLRFARRARPAGEPVPINHGALRAE